MVRMDLNMLGINNAFQLKIVVSDGSVNGETTK